MKQAVLSTLLYFFLTAPLCADTSDKASIQQSILTPKVEKKEVEPVPAAPVLPHEMAPEAPVPMPSYGMTFAKMILTLAGLILLVITTVWLLKKLMQGKIGSFGKKHIQILERRPLSPKTVLYVIEFAGQQMIVAESQMEIRKLSSVEIHSADV
jgi:flagellar protein FliO/FliZ